MALKDVLPSSHWKGRREKLASAFCLRPTSRPKLRAAGFQVFAWLSRTAAAEPNEHARAAFGEHAHALLPILLLKVVEIHVMCI